MAASKQHLKIILQIVAVALIIVLAIKLAGVAEENEAIQALVSSYGYLGAFFISFISGFNLVVPIPAVAFMPLFLASGLDFFMTILVISAGMVTADSIGYLMGRVGARTASHIFGESHPMLARLEGLRHRYRFAPLIVLFLFASLAPFPNEVFVVPLGALGYRFTTIIPILFVGNIIFNTLYSTGLINLSNIFQ